MSQTQTDFNARYLAGYDDGASHVPVQSHDPYYLAGWRRGHLGPSAARLWTTESPREQQQAA